MKELPPQFQQVLLREFDKVYETELTKELLDRVSDARMKAMALGEVSDAERNQMVGYAHGIADALHIVYSTMQNALKEELD
jgi:hypothetical protein